MSTFSADGVLGESTVRPETPAKAPILSRVVPSGDRPALADITGPARVVDGDTLHVQGVKIRLSDIDAPERRQTCWGASGEFRCGLRATAVLRAIIGGHEVRCVKMGRDRYQRILAICYVGKLDIGGELVRQGWALAYRRYGLTYVRQETEARAAKRGLWATRFVAPWQWRRRRRESR